MFNVGAERVGRQRYSPHRLHCGDWSMRSKLANGNSLVHIVTPKCLKKSIFDKVLHISICRENNSNYQSTAFAFMFNYEAALCVEGL